MTLSSACSCARSRYALEARSPPPSAESLCARQYPYMSVPGECLLVLALFVLPPPPRTLPVCARWQIPEVEALEADLLKTVPSLDEPAELYRHLKVYEDLAEKALQACQRLKVGTDDREFNWKARVGPEDDEDEDDDEDNIARSPKNVKGAEAQPKYTTADLGRFMREGVLGR